MKLQESHEFSPVCGLDILRIKEFLKQNITEKLTIIDHQGNEYLIHQRQDDLKWEAEKGFLRVLDVEAINKYGLSLSPSSQGLVTQFFDQQAVLSKSGIQDSKGYVSTAVLELLYGRPNTPKKSNDPIPVVTRNRRRNRNKITNGQ